MQKHQQQYYNLFDGSLPSFFSTYGYTGVDSYNGSTSLNSTGNSAANSPDHQLVDLSSGTAVYESPPQQFHRQFYHPQIYPDELELQHPVYLQQHHQPQQVETHQTPGTNTQQQLLPQPTFSEVKRVSSPPGTIPAKTLKRKLSDSDYETDGNHSSSSSSTCDSSNSRPSKIRRKSPETTIKENLVPKKTAVRERQRTRELNDAYIQLRNLVPSVPNDTNTKIDVIKRTYRYIRFLHQVVFWHENQNDTALSQAVQAVFQQQRSTEFAVSADANYAQTQQQQSEKLAYAFRVWRNVDDYQEDSPLKFI